jgi:hypothetical protein
MRSSHFLYVAKPDTVQMRRELIFIGLGRHCRRPRQVSVEVEIPDMGRDVALRQHTSPIWCSRYSSIANSRRVRSICSPPSHTSRVAGSNRSSPAFEHGGPRLHPATAQGPQPGNQHRVRERFGQVIVGAGEQPLDLVPYAVLRGQHQDRGPVAFAAQRPAHLVTVRAWQHDVENDGVKRVFTAIHMPSVPLCATSTVKPSASSPFRSPAASRCSSSTTSSRIVAVMIPARN